MDAVFDCRLGRELTPEEVAALPPAPLPELADRKAEMWAEVKQWRARLTDSPGATVTTPAGVVQSDGKSQQNILGLVQMAVLSQIAAQPFSADFTLADNTVVTLDASQMIGLGVAVGTHVQTVYAQATSLRIQIEAAEDHDALDLVRDGSEVWPPEPEPEPDPEEPEEPESEP